MSETMDTKPSRTPRRILITLAISFGLLATTAIAIDVPEAAAQTEGSNAPCSEIELADDGSGCNATQILSGGSCYSIGWFTRRCDNYAVQYRANGKTCVQMGGFDRNIFSSSIYNVWQSPIRCF